MSPLEALHELRSRRLVTADAGEPCDAELLEPMTDAEITRVEEGVGAPVPADIRELMRFAGGAEIDGDELSWNGRAFGQDVPGAFASWLPLMDDGAGNSWNVDIDPTTGAWGAVYYACHDPAVLLLQARSLAEFLVQIADDCCQAGREGPVHEVADRMVRRVGTSGGALRPAPELRTSADPVLRRAAQAPGDAEVCDLRGARRGDGFRWDRFGARTLVSRPGPEAVWVLQRPPATKRWWRLGA